jgi:uncharacterized membrane protein
VFVYNFLWIGVFAALVFETGRFTNTYFSKRKISWSSIIVGLMFVALGMILQGALDAIVLLYRLGPVNETLIGVETVSGILIAMFGGLLNSTIHGQEETALDSSEEKEGAELITRAFK